MLTQIASTSFNRTLLSNFFGFHRLGGLFVTEPTRKSTENSVLFELKEAYSLRLQTRFTSPLKLGLLEVHVFSQTNRKARSSRPNQSRPDRTNDELLDTDLHRRGGPTGA